jgi:hypothetical protein
MWESMEQTLWSTVRGLEGNMLLLQHLSRHADEHADRATADSIRQKLQHVVHCMDLVRQATTGYEQLDTTLLRPEPDVG